MNVVTGIFLGKNNFDYADKQEVVVTPNNPLGDYADAKQLSDYIEATVVDD
jgi:histidinol-phosphate/aromatic aminotransferase/cobyric acid decarboxylase-like protein